MRSFVSTRELTKEQARYFAEVDQIRHVAICAVEPTVAEERGYGIARFMRDVDNPAAAEFAVAVIDEMQQRGLGTLLLAALYLRAQALGVAELRSEILAENPVMPRSLPRLGGAILPAGHPAYRVIRWPVAPVGERPVVDHVADDNFMIALDRLRLDFGS
jgi:GNAT superfamily N-acetyltransferase